MRQIHIFYYWAIISHHIVSRFLKICTDLHWYDHKIVIVWHLKLFKNNNKSNFVVKFVQIFRNTGTMPCQMMASYRNDRSVWWRLSCTFDFMCDQPFYWLIAFLAKSERMHIAQHHSSAAADYFELELTLVWFWVSTQLEFHS